MYHWSSVITKINSRAKSLIYPLLILLAFFLLLRLPSLHQTYHQDEVKWVTHATTIGDNATGKGHPPLSGIIFPLFGKILGAQNMRALPLLFGLLNCLLLFFLVKPRFDKTTAFWVVGVYVLVFYNVLASLMVDLDGAFLPFFVLLFLITFFRWKESSQPHQRWYWAVSLGLTTLLGFMAKLNFIIPVIAVLIFYVGETDVVRFNFKNITRLVITGLVGVATILACFLITKYLFPAFNLGRVFAHATDFFSFRGRDFGQVIFQTAKAVIYASPLLIIPLFLISKEQFKQLRFYFWFLAVGLVFYYLLFDFSRAALDKYLAFIIVPLSIISGVVLKSYFEAWSGFNKKIVWGGGLILVGIFMTQFFSHLVPPLYPKAEWFSRVTNLHWNFLMPFTGGSGPLGFYVSFLFIVLIWLYSLVLLVWSFVQKNRRSVLIVLLLVAGVLYNLVFIEEYALGKINGNAAGLLNGAVFFIKDNDQIDRVITYNDIGGFELASIGKYERRIYVAPKNDAEHKQTLNNFKKYYLVIDIPRLSMDSIYAKYFSTCQVVYSDQSQQISAKLYDCKNAMNF
ncbi:MAG: hypothetical protein UU67_C0001G0006 [Candidatus Daviesbacteria bacterium GW2011_GWB1_41_5]|uniref:Glycosyltransferase RgtA/B/C/D-like domain-containing protein n=1 Tax=Candidatus Daviesbacteria bacterium GW2011_GWB1_41_5 TaxID=1618429 RepID=A0A0G0WNP2_9BACT|nr:MAG: hypothetical protein UU67_C0001G0006 [Candidatus Daviesbacteria bacterium GW2011_GWB1_41_5]